MTPEPALKSRSTRWRHWLQRMVGRPLAALWWVVRNKLSSRQAYCVRYYLDGEAYGGEIRARSWEEAAGICKPRGYILEGKVAIQIMDCPLARWLAGRISNR